MQIADINMHDDDQTTKAITYGAGIVNISMPCSPLKHSLLCMVLGHAAMSIHMSGK